MQASFQVLYRLQSTPLQQQHAVELHGDATIEEVRWILERHGKDLAEGPENSVVDELRRTVQLWLFRDGVAVVERIEDITFEPDLLPRNRVLGLDGESIPGKPILWHPSDMELNFRFNPQTERGKAFVAVSFSLYILVQPGKFETAQESVASRLNYAKSRCLELLSSRSVTELSSVEGKKHLERLLIDELTNSFFPEPVGERIAVVFGIFWTHFLVQ